MAMIAAGLCAQGCGAVASAFAGGPVIGAISMAAALGYGLYSMTSSKEDDFVDAVEDEADFQPVKGIVKIAVKGGIVDGTNLGDTSSFL